jgi:phage shock protein PspC (stress-responsive transcriptional regulator)
MNEILIRLFFGVLFGIFNLCFVVLIVYLAEWKPKGEMKA